MSTSLRDQLLKAGLVTEAQAKQAAQQQDRAQRHRDHQQKRRPVGAKPALSKAQAEAQAAKVARDAELNRQREEKAARKALRAQIDQLVEQARVPAVETDEFYNFVDGSRIRRLSVDASLRERLGRGELAIVRHRGSYALVPAEAAARVRERDERLVIAARSDDGRPEAGAPDPDDPYRDFPVPDDLTW